MAKMIRAVFDGEVLRPELPTDLKPNTTYLLTVEREVTEGGEESADPDAYLLAQIGRLATDMGVTDLSEAHDRYARGLIPLHDRDS